MSKRKIAIYTGNRAEYGLQYPIIRAVSAHSNLDPYLLVSGAHLREDFGFTANEIKKDGFKIYDEIKIDGYDDTLLGTAQAIGTGILSLSKSLAQLKPDLLVVYADRFESFSAVITGTQMGIPTAHVEGGDITEGGALDDSVRHAMTKLAHLHFATNEEAAERIRKLGEEPWRVFNVGFPAIDLIKDKIYATPEELKERYHLDLNRPVILFTQHSITTELDLVLPQIRPCLQALEKISEQGVQVIITYPNNDAGGKRIIEEIQKTSEKNLPNIQVHKSLGRYNYHGVLNLCGRVTGGACVGNSSSGIKETPTFGCSFVNIGLRQKGRLRANNVIDVDYNAEEILHAMRRTIDDEAFKNQVRTCHNPYGVGESGKKIAAVLSEIEISPKLIQKQMTY